MSCVNRLIGLYERSVLPAAQGMVYGKVAPALLHGSCCLRGILYCLGIKVEVYSVNAVMSDAYNVAQHTGTCASTHELVCATRMLV